MGRSSCCCRCRYPKHSHQDGGERCLLCKKHRPPRGRIVYEEHWQGPARLPVYESLVMDYPELCVDMGVLHFHHHGRILYLWGVTAWDQDGCVASATAELDSPESAAAEVRRLLEGGK